ncbi:MAG TPA: hypothetical protein DCX25_00675 [Candidatus Pacebacteria bacterium]|nr:MAG: hypothetical protein UX00_C0003G0119 [Microgenomates group bacterium GW2011_GWB1_45_17]KKU22926.1 MAG: hypothetical protein UX35_C0013G0003 [Microgenomates group bacterium GW2011_GWA1_46_15]KKU24077.1 MAG: hypothetical protein UX36_C0002G0060 [Microgenomates group bacterium GW2011_GWC1_46_15]HAV14834.1 hypothetical protein [Candidatus Paceibacterota bacterium]HCR11225.1 hypothetical protein [Candidatus Paceibacterota bacterium]
MKSYQSYLDQKHAGLNTPDSILNAVVHRATGSEVVHKQKVILGEVNEVYAITLRNGKHIVARISRSEKPRFLAEKWAINQVKKIGVLAPEILLVTSVQHGDEKLTFSIETALLGTPLSTIQDHVQVLKFVRKAGAILAKIHSVKTRGYGGLNRFGKGKYNTWFEYMMEAKRDRDLAVEAAEHMGIEADKIDKVIRTLEDHQALFDVSPQLLHSDFSTKHILVNGDKITGIIDFENCRSGDPMWDFAWWDYFFGRDLSVDILRAGYEQVAPVIAEFGKKLFLYRLRMGLSFIQYYKKEENEAGMNHAKEQFLRDWKTM